jgi:hypothetical protein
MAHPDYIVSNVVALTLLAAVAAGSPVKRSQTWRSFDHRDGRRSPPPQDPVNARRAVMLATGGHCCR